MDTLKDFLKPEIIWCLVGLVLLLMEFAVPGLILFFFAIGAWIVALVCLFWDSAGLDAQLIIFLIASITSLLALRRYLKNIFHGHIRSVQSGKQDLDEFVGQRVTVRSAIPANGTGRVEFRGTEWNATSDDPLAPGEPAEIISKDNLTLKVKKLDQ
ncbi:hypothetical protein STSP2_03520 [Anaerohalosphaera lusitana]|uniref:NfeD-like C-terminal domain-containing protein n=1 Tax=Anaerohalosphaera lusitana TaxID=1936003 RepID=A0A1U9NRF6_9BACT|nr:NfeD family protein [Anaerohalosphaera lusitana]AQT70314.1 hypothetical protein STSP2_03520 [Anaerohalosphaera lusitana]